MHLPMIRCLAAALLVLHVGVAPAAVGAAPGALAYAGCSPFRHAPGTAFESDLNSLLASIASTAASGATTYSSFAAHGVTAPAPAPSAAAAAAYGLYRCRGDLGARGCAACVRDAVARLRLGAACALRAHAASLRSPRGCYVRYGARALAAGDAVPYRRCGSGASGDAGFLRARDAVLADLQRAGQEEANPAAVGDGGAFKATASGPVHGVAQCLGGIPAAGCTSCLEEAVGQIKATCGGAVAADVYLARCSLRFWADGNYARPSQDAGDDAGRTLAIAIGISAGIALLVVFVSFLRKACH